MEPEESEEDRENLKETLRTILQNFDSEHKKYCREIEDLLTKSEKLKGKNLRNLIQAYILLKAGDPLDRYTALRWKGEEEKRTGPLRKEYSPSTLIDKFNKMGTKISLKKAKRLCKAVEILDSSLGVCFNSERLYKKSVDFFEEARKVLRTIGVKI